MKLFAIIGHPVLHSLSPIMYNTAFGALGLDCRYEAIDVEPSGLKDIISMVRERGYSGYNVTVPHKEAMFSLVHEVSDEAKIVGAINTVVRQDGRYIGHNTDVYGFLKSIEPVQSAFTKGTVTILGAGGAARAVLYALLTLRGPERILVLNRNPERAERLVRDFDSIAGKTRLASGPLFDENLQESIDRTSTIINTTSVGMRPYVHASPLEEIKIRKSQTVIDLIYTPLETKLVKAALHSGASAVAGLEMLLHQGAKSFELWTGLEMPIESVRGKLREQLRG